MTRNTNGDFGIGIAADRQSMQDGNWKNDTRKVKLTVSIGKTPAHLQVLDSFSGGSKWVTDLAQVVALEETLFQIEHKLPFKPKFLCYFKCTDSPAPFNMNIGQYQQNIATMLTNSFPIGNEWLEAGSDEKYFFIKHKMSQSGAGIGSNTYYGSDYKFRVRFEILNIKAL